MTVGPARANGKRSALRIAVLALICIGWGWSLARADDHRAAPQVSSDRIARTLGDFQAAEDVFARGVDETLRAHLVEVFARAPAVGRFRRRVIESTQHLPAADLLEYFHFRNALHLALLAQDDAFLEGLMRLNVRLLERLGSGSCDTPIRSEQFAATDLEEYKRSLEAVAAAVDSAPEIRHIRSTDEEIDAAYAGILFELPAQQRALIERLDRGEADQLTAAEGCQAMLWRWKAVLDGPQPNRAVLVRHLLRSGAVDPAQFASFVHEEPKQQTTWSAVAGNPSPAAVTSRSYPPIAALLGIEATIVVEVTIDARGELEAAFIRERRIRVPGPKDVYPLIFERLFDSGSLQVAQARRYRPRYDSGRRISYVATFEVEWKLDK